MSTAKMRVAPAFLAACEVVNNGETTDRRMDVTNQDGTVEAGGGAICPCMGFRKHPALATQNKLICMHPPL